MKPQRAGTDRIAHSSAKVDGIRLGPGRKRAISLDGAHVPALPVVEAPAMPAVDWAGFADAIRLTRLERSVFFKIWRDSEPKYRVHQALGCTVREIEKAYISIVVKMQTGGGNDRITFESWDSLRPVYRRQGVYPLGKLGPEFAQIMFEEKYFGLFSPDLSATSESRSSISKKSHVFCPRLLIEGVFMKSVDDGRRGELVAVKVRRELGQAKVS